MTEPDSMTAREICAAVLRGWRRWPSLALILLRWAAHQTRLHLACWRAGLSVREARRMVRLLDLAGELPR